MSQAAKSATTNRLHFASTGATHRRSPEVALVLSADQAKVLWELCALSAYHPDGFTHTQEMTAVCEFIADRSGPAAIAMCLARADIRERTYIAR